MDYRLQYLENGDDGKALCIGEDRGRDDLVRAKGLSRINETAHTVRHTAHTEREEEAYEARIRPTFLETFALARCPYTKDKAI